MKKISLRAGGLVLTVISVLAFEAGRAMPTTACTRPELPARTPASHRTHLQFQL
jgi:hypothetical protein